MTATTPIVLYSLLVPPETALPHQAHQSCQDQNKTTQYLDNSQSLFSENAKEHPCLVDWAAVIRMVKYLYIATSGHSNPLAPHQ